MKPFIPYWLGIPILIGSLSGIGYFVYLSIKGLIETYKSDEVVYEIEDDYDYMGGM